MLKWTSGGSLNTAEYSQDCDITKARDVCSSTPHSFNQSSSSSLTYESTSMDLDLAIGSNGTPEQYKNAVKQARTCDRNVLLSKRDRSMPPSVESLGLTETHQDENVNLRKGGLLTKFRKMFKRSSSKGHGTKSAPNSPTTFGSSHRIDGNLNESRVDGRPPPPSSSKGRKSRLERLIDANRDNRRYKERLHEAQTKVSSPFLNVSGDDRCRSLHSEAKNKQQTSWNQVLHEMNTASHVKRNARERHQNGEQKSVASMDISQFSKQATKLENKIQNNAECKRRRFTAKSTPTQSDPCILLRMLERTAPNTPNSKQITLLDKKSDRSKAKTDKRENVPPSAIENSCLQFADRGRSPKLESVDFNLWLEKIRQIDALTLHRVKKSLNRTNTPEKSITPDGKLRPSDGKFMWSCSKDGSLIVSPKSKLRKSLPITPHRNISNYDKNTPRNNNNGRDSVHSDMNMLAEKHFHDLTSWSVDRFIERPTKRASFPLSADKNETSLTRSLCQRLSHNLDSDDSSRVKRIVHSLEKKISSKTMDLRSTISPVSSLVKHSKLAVTEDIAFEEQTSNTKLTSENKPPNSTEKTSSIEHSSSSKEDTSFLSNTSQFSLSQGFDPELSQSVNYSNVITIENGQVEDDKDFPSEEGELYSKVYNTEEPLPSLAHTDEFVTQTNTENASSILFPNPNVFPADVTQNSYESSLHVDLQLNELFMTDSDDLSPMISELHHVSHVMELECLSLNEKSESPVLSRYEDDDDGMFCQSISLNKSELDVNHKDPSHTNSQARDIIQPHLKNTEIADKDVIQAIEETELLSKNSIADKDVIQAIKETVSLSKDSIADKDVIQAIEETVSLSKDSIADKEVIQAIEETDSLSKDSIADKDVIQAIEETDSLSKDSIADKDVIQTIEETDSLSKDSIADKDVIQAIEETDSLSKDSIADKDVIQAIEETDSLSKDSREISQDKENSHSQNYEDFENLKSTGRVIKIVAPRHEDATSFGFNQNIQEQANSGGTRIECTTESDTDLEIINKDNQQPSSRLSTESISPQLNTSLTSLGSLTDRMDDHVGSCHQSQSNQAINCQNKTLDCQISQKDVEQECEVVIKQNHHEYNLSQEGFREVNDPLKQIELEGEDGDKIYASESVLLRKCEDAKNEFPNGRKTPESIDILLPSHSTFSSSDKAIMGLSFASSDISISTRKGDVCVDISVCASDSLCNLSVFSKEHDTDESELQAWSVNPHVLNTLIENSVEGEKIEHNSSDAHADMSRHDFLYDEQSESNLKDSDIVLSESQNAINDTVEISGWDTCQGQDAIENTRQEDEAAFANVALEDDTITHTNTIDEVCFDNFESLSSVGNIFNTAARRRMDYSDGLENKFEEDEFLHSPEICEFSAYSTDLDLHGCDLVCKKEYHKNPDFQINFESPEKYLKFARSRYTSRFNAATSATKAKSVVACDHVTATNYDDPNGCEGMSSSKKRHGMYDDSILYEGQMDLSDCIENASSCTNESSLSDESDTIFSPHKSSSIDDGIDTPPNLCSHSFDSAPSLATDNHRSCFNNTMLNELSASFLTDMSEDGSGDCSEPYEITEKTNPSEKYLWRQTHPAYAKTQMESLHSERSHLSLASTKKEKQLLKQKYLRETRRKPMKRNINTRSMANIEDLNMLRYVSNGEGRKPLGRHFRYHERYHVDSVSSRAASENEEKTRSSISIPKERNQTDQVLHEGSDKSRSRCGQEEKVAGSTHEGKSKQWLFLATLLFFQFLIHWLYAR